METLFEREALFKEVWEEPLTKLSKKYGLSDNGLRKVCKALSIPLPPKGHWARAASGQNMKPPWLPPTAGPTQFASYGKAPPMEAPSTPELAASEQWLQDQVKMERGPDRVITIDDDLSAALPAVAAAARAFSVKLAQLEKSRLAIEKASKRAPGEKWEPTRASLDPNGWRQFVEKGEIIGLPPESLPLQVSEESVDRALRIWNALMVACIARGHKLTTAGMLSISGQREKIPLRMTERVERVMAPEKGFSPVQILMREHIHGVPSGELRIFIGDRLYVSKVEDVPGRPLESQLNLVFEKAYRLIAAAKIREARLEIRARQYQIERQAKADAQAAAANNARMIEEEKRLEEGLLIEAERWKDAALIQAYLAHIRHASSAGDKEPSEEMTKWLTWADTVARKMDPTLKRLE